ncbi:MAG: HAD family phosphatase [Bacteroidales bacterium]|jgi:putative hydrolase of the HAD superfamily
MTKNIIFDLGVVLLNIDFQKTMNEFEKLGISNINEIYSGYDQREIFDKFDKGLISSIEFRNEIRKFIKKPVTDEMIDYAWNAMILDFPPERINMLIRLKKSYRIFLLSNTNAIHFPVYNKQLKDRFHIVNLSELFEKAYYSFILGLRKPDKEIFELVLMENKLNPTETLFIDDSPNYITAAINMGINAHLLKSPQTVVDCIKEIL